MNTVGPLPAPALPSQVRQVLATFTASAKDALGAGLSSMILYGSAAEGHLRPTSDVNLLLVLFSFEPSRVDALREPLRMAGAAVRLRAMFLLQDEISAATRSFASKFADILRRRFILHGPDPFAAVSIPRGVEVEQLQQQLLNFVLRLRAAYVSLSLREEQLALRIAEAIGPLRSYAASLLELQGLPPEPPADALERISEILEVRDWPVTAGFISDIQNRRPLPAGRAGAVAFQLMEMAQRMRMRVASLA